MDGNDAGRALAAESWIVLKRFCGVREEWPRDASRREALRYRISEACFELGAGDSRDHSVWEESRGPL